MARSGLYKSEVKKARDVIIANGKHPSVDAVRIALGNTGSKTTIHKYLKELEEEDGGAGGRKASISEALQDLVERLSGQLQEEANAQSDALRNEHTEEMRRHAEALDAAHQENEQIKAQLRRIEASLQQEQAAHGATREALQRESIARHTAEQQIIDFRERLTENETHRQSLEDKHQHAREALEHYRQSVKEQRDQDQRRHEQQIQQLQAELRQAQQTIVVKQENLTRLNQEGARLVSDLAHAQKALYEEQAHSRRLTQKVEALQAVEQRAATLEAQLGERTAQAQHLQDQLKTATDRIDGMVSQVRDLELVLAQSQAKCDAQQGMVAELRAYLDTRQQPPAANGAR